MKSLDLEIEPIIGENWYKYEPSTRSLQTERIGSPATLSGEIPDVTGHVPEMGATVRLTVDGVVVFYGRIFLATLDRWGVLEFTAYDLLRYLKGNYSAFLKSCSPEDVIREVCRIYDLPVGTLETTGFKSRAQTFENESALDCIQKMIDLATVKTKQIWVLYDDIGKICLRRADNMTSDVVIGDDSLATDYTLSIDIDSDTYNYVLIHKPNAGGGVNVTKTASDTETEKKWGRLILFEDADENMNSAQMQQKADNLLKMKNRAARSMTITCFGVVGIRAGMMVTLNFPSMPTISSRQLVVLDAVTHTFEQSVHMMELQTRTLWEDSPK